MIGHQQTVGQQLERVEGGIDLDVSIRELATQRIGKTEKEGVAGGEDNDEPPPFPLQREREMCILLKNAVEGDGDVYPLAVGRQQGGDDVVVALTTGEHPTLTDDVQNLGRKPRLRVIGDTYDYKLHSGGKFFTVNSSLFTSTGRALALVVRHR